jgi:hypothetical protein
LTITTCMTTFPSGIDSSANKILLTNRGLIQPHQNIPTHHTC